MRIGYHLVYAPSIHTRRASIARDVKQCFRHVRRLHHFVQKKTRALFWGGRTDRLPCLRCMQQERSPFRYAGLSIGLIPLRAVGEHEVLLTGFYSFQPVTPFAPPALPGFIARMG